MNAVLEEIPMNLVSILEIYLLQNSVSATKKFSGLTLQRLSIKSVAKNCIIYLLYRDALRWGAG